jgi:RNA polymerase sigma-70 factor, ECF subfamily
VPGQQGTAGRVRWAGDLTAGWLRGRCDVSHSAAPEPPADTAHALLTAARHGDADAFGHLTTGLRRELHVHCYRMLGTATDADDALQDTLVRAWRGLDRFEPRQPLRAWMYRIATNVCLTMLDRRTRRVALDPYPDHLLDGPGDDTLTPEATVVRQESVELAFLVALQTLPPRQRAVLLLRDVLELPAVEVADMLDTSVAGVNSALQRARSTCLAERRAGRISMSHTPHPTGVEAALVRRFAAAWRAADVSALAQLLVEDALLTMPPELLRIVGRDEVAAFLLTVPGHGRPDRLRSVATRANRQPALAVYHVPDHQDPPPVPDSADQYLPYAVMVFSLHAGRIASVTRFGVPDMFHRFGLPGVG